jgi:heme-degrading monooxygenase HmoA
MFARKVAALLKPNSLAEFENLMEREILPWLRNQDGFLDLIVLAVPGGREVATISFWDHQAHAEAYNSKNYPEVLGILENLLDGTPYVKTFDVVSSTFPRVNRRVNNRSNDHGTEVIIQRTPEPFTDPCAKSTLSLNSTVNK